MTKEQIIRKHYTFYDKNLSIMDVELNGEQVQNLMEEYAQQEVAKEREKAKKLYEALAGALSIIEMASNGVDMPNYTSCVGYINGKQSLTEYEKL